MFFIAQQYSLRDYWLFIFINISSKSANMLVYVIFIFILFSVLGRL